MRKTRRRQGYRRAASTEGLDGWLACPVVTFPVFAPRRRGPSTRRLAVPAVTLVTLAACSGAPSTLDPAGPGARRTAVLWWFMFAVAAAVCLLVAALIGVAVLVRRRRARPDVTPRWANRLIAGGGVVFPLVVLSVLWVFTLRELRASSAPVSGERLSVTVVGHQWWWEIRFPDEGIVTANDLHVPVGRPVTVRLQAADVIHSFWVPQLTPKIDNVPGRTNVLSLRADRPGVYRGMCAEFCGVQHANMAFFVIAEPAADFEAWLARERADARTPGTSALADGLRVFETNACAGCHTIRGTQAGGVVGPDLTHVGSRRTLGAGAAPNDPGHLVGWIENASTFKPGVLMPPISLAPADLRAVAAYLESLE